MPGSKGWSEGNVKRDKFGRFLAQDGTVSDKQSMSFSSKINTSGPLKTFINTDMRRLRTFSPMKSSKSSPFK